MAGNSETATTPLPGLPRTVLYALAFLLLGSISNALWIPFATIPTIVSVSLSGSASTSMLTTALFGLFIAMSTSTVPTLLERYEENEPLNSAPDELPDDDVKAYLKSAGIIIFLIVLYMNIVVGVAMGLATVIPEFATYVLLFTPVLDYYLIDLTDYSPVLLLVAAVAALAVAVGIADDVNLDAVRLGSPLAFS